MSLEEVRDYYARIRAERQQQRFPIAIKLSWWKQLTSRIARKGKVNDKK